MSEARWGIIGFGEAGSTFARQLSSRSGKPVLVADPLLNRLPPPDHIRQRLANLKIEIAPDVPHLVSACDVVLSLVTPRVAAQVAEEAAGGRGQGLFIDFNSLSPAEKRRMGELFVEGAFVEGAILGGIAGEGIRARLALAGPRSGEAQTLLNGLGFNSFVVSSALGGASSLKMCRSVFMKGMECLLVETLLAAAQYGVTDAVLESIEDTFSSHGLRPMIKMLLTTHAAHCGRRSDEMRAVARMLKEAGLPSHMSEASESTLLGSSRSGVTDHFGSAVPESAEEVIQFLFRSYHHEES